MVKCLPATRETQVQSLGGEDPLEKEMATHSSTLAWKIPWTEEPGRLQSSSVTSRVQIFSTSWTVARQAPLSSTISQNLLKFMSIESVMLSNHLILQFSSVA